MNRAPFLLLLLAACGPVVQIGSSSSGTKRVDLLYTLTAPPPASVPAGIVPLDIARAVTVETPSLPGTLQTQRIPVSVSDTEVRYVQEALWAEQPNRLFQRLLADRLVSAGVAVIDGRTSSEVAGRRLSGQLLAFGADVRDTQRAHIRFDATLVSATGVRQRRFERELPLARVGGAETAAALNAAANAVADDVANWVRTAQ